MGDGLGLWFGQGLVIVLCRGSYLAYESDIAEAWRCSLT